MKPLGREPFSDRAMSRELPTTPPVYVQRSPSHVAASWTAACTATTFVAACRDLGGVGPKTEVVVDDPAVAGRQRQALREVDVESASYLRIEPSAPDWRADWDDRSMAVVSIDGRFSVRTCERLHVATTACRGWDDEAQARGAELFDGFDTF